MAQTVKRLPTMRETWVQSLGWEDLLEKEMETQSSILAWRILWTEELGRLHTVHGSIYCHSAYLTYMQSISSEMLGWMTQKLEPRLLGEISTTSNM